MAKLRGGALNRLQAAADSPAPDSSTESVELRDLRALHSHVLRLQAQVTAAEAKASYAASLQATVEQLAAANKALTAAMDAIMAGGGE